MIHESEYASKERVSILENLEDLTADTNGVNPINLLLATIAENIKSVGIHKSATILRGNRIVTVENNFNRLLFPDNSVMRLPIHTYYKDSNLVFRTQMSCELPPFLESVNTIDDQLVFAPGLVFRQEGNHHQLDIWALKRSSKPLQNSELCQLLKTSVAGLLDPNQDIELVSKQLYYIENGVSIKTDMFGRRVTVASGGHIHRKLIEDSGNDPNRYRGFVLGLSLDRLAMLKKNVRDVRIFRDKDPRVIEQMRDLSPLHEVSKMPATNRDISISTDSRIELSNLRSYLEKMLNEDQKAIIEDIQILSTTAYDSLSEVARQRLGMTREESNVLMRFVLRSFNRTLTKNEANDLRENIFSLLHHLSLQTLNETLQSTQ